MQLHPLFAAYLSHLERKARDPKTIDRNRCSFVRFQKWCDDQGIDPKEATEVLLEEYVSYLTATLAKATANRETAHVRSAYRYAVRIGMLETNPAADVETPKVPDRLPDVYSNEELRRIRASIMDGLEESVFYAFSYAGLRRHELAGLTWSAVNFEDQFLVVNGKGGKMRRVPLHPALADVLATRRRQHPDSETVLGAGGSSRNVNARVAALLERAGVDGGTRPCHKFRRTVASSLIEEGVAYDVVDSLMGWAPTSIRGRYYVRVPERSLYEAVLRLYRTDPIERRPVGERKT
jgi:site-specific recombinase XerD